MDMGYRTVHYNSIYYIEHVAYTDILQKLNDVKLALAVKESELEMLKKGSKSRDKEEPPIITEADKVLIIENINSNMKHEIAKCGEAIREMLERRPELLLGK